MKAAPLKRRGAKAKRQKGGGGQAAPPRSREGKSSPTQNITQRRRRQSSTTVLEPGSHVDTEIDVKVQPEMLKVCQRESIFASDEHGCSQARHSKEEERLIAAADVAIA